MTEKQVFSETHTRVILEQGHGNHFTVRVGLRWILTFGVSPRKVRTWNGQDVFSSFRTTRKDHAVSGWRTGVLSGIRAYCGSLLGLVCDLAGYGLDVEPVLERAEELGWPETITNEARARAEESYRYQAEQVADLPAVSLLSVSFVDKTSVEIWANGDAFVSPPEPWIEDVQPYVTVSRACLAGPGCITDERRMLDAVHTGLTGAITDLTVGGHETGSTERVVQTLKDMLRAVEEQVLL